MSSKKIPNQFRCSVPGCQWWMDAIEGSIRPEVCPECGASTKTTCGARLRRKEGQRCGVRSRIGKRCRIHGGKSLKGPASPRYTDGAYSKYAPYVPKSWRETYDAAINSKNLRLHISNLALLQGMRDAWAKRYEAAVDPEQRIAAEREIRRIMKQETMLRKTMHDQDQKIGRDEATALLAAARQRMIDAATKVMNRKQLHTFVSLLSADRAPELRTQRGGLA